MRKHTLYDDGKISWTVFGRDPERPDALIDTNEYLITCGDDALLLDPGGSEIFAHVLPAVSEVTEIANIRAYLCSHQDPDIMSSLPLWMALTPNAKIYISWLWKGFVAHFGERYVANMVTVPDEGQSIYLGETPFHVIPAHHCHSAGNFSLFDPASRILFSGDIGAALVPADYDLTVTDFDAHIRYMEGFHRRWMPSNEAKNLWIRRVRRLEPSMICPQHGAIMTGENVERFLDWFQHLNVGQLGERG